MVLQELTSLNQGEAAGGGSSGHRSPEDRDLRKVSPWTPRPQQDSPWAPGVLGALEGRAPPCLLQ